MKLVPKNWASFQHYKNRSPAWIKLHKSLLDDFDFQRLHVASRALAPCLWLLASEEKEGVIDASLEKLSFRLRISEAELEPALNELIDKGFFSVVQSASTALAGCKPDAMPEKRREEKKNLTTFAPDDPKPPDRPGPAKGLRKSKAPPRVQWTEAGGFTVEEGVLKGWRRACPAVNFETEVARAHAWIVANPKNRKSNWQRFLTAWLIRAQDKAPRVPTDGRGADGAPRLVV